MACTVTTSNIRTLMHRVKHLLRILVILLVAMFFAAGNLNSQALLSINHRNFDSFGASLDVTQKINKDIYFNSWSAYQSADRRYDNLSSYFTTLNTINYKLGRVTIGSGFQYYRDYRWDFKYTAWISKLSIRLY